MFLWYLSAEASQGRGSCAEHGRNGTALQQSPPPPRLRQMEGKNQRDRLALLPRQQHNHPCVRRWNTGESCSHTKTECLLLTGICCPGSPLCSPARRTLPLFLRLILKSDFRAKVATWKTEKLYLRNKYSLGSGSASHTSSWKGTGK